MKSGNGVLILILGILSIVSFGLLTGIPAWILGNNALADIQSGRADRSEEGMVNAGRVLGMIGTLLSCIPCLFLLSLTGLVSVGSLFAR